jgi:hypothetical protein
MAEKTIEGVAILYLDKWIQRKKLENHDRNNSSKNNFLWSEFMEGAPLHVQFFFLHF